ncbi:peptidoglycan DD-metalloendopeptidase family protein [Photobacterium damselae]|uniref:Peptidoglycan DD-metalloendopeptidase family protein n=5 Tax=Photobacterium damselae TaxID=38293 RepID=A0A4S2JFI6_PHODD|nr:peptidoglycan DD-metalloendopeptidase family protein [Photobacterium damselae]ELI6447573.1 peptidoglycan DD-metalloendopeptidase family protein [Photobacterium damselae]ELV7516542.1 peptidoglycan DD-metalloendopeptidase family protein [Photobacterium damselae]KAB1180144.1 peptidoglycan DD-metalloendopeptidase family protein [Photobacterium damselae subsp. damselae]KAB1180777.1 peptidoglycan DD-metalloendopeptidase family protein [Photobacterium damselae subsp. damselae]MBF7099833.1 peptidog
MRDMIKHLNQTIRAGALCTGALLCLAFVTPSYATSPNQLDSVKQEIARQKSQLAKKQQEFAALQKELRQHELGIGKTAKQIHQAQAQLETLKRSIAQLESEQKKLEAEQKKQQQQLKALLDAQYRQGKNSEIANLLSGENSSTLDRMTAYAETFSLAQTKALENLEVTNTELQMKLHQLSTQREQQRAMLSQLQQEKAELDSQQKAREKTLAGIKGKIRTSNDYINDLKANERRMLAAIAKAKAEAEARARAEAAAKKAAEAAKRLPMNGLSSSKGKLPWPVRGSVIHNYGDRQQGELRWKGMVIAKPVGSQVTAISSGRVVFADWLRGYGLMIVIEHGKGDMSIYGYNQTLLKKVGDPVSAGEPIALVGDSGGQDRSGLYFEIRRKGSPVNPRSWLK